MGKIVIYQIFTRLFGNRHRSFVENGTIAENGCGKFVDFDMDVLSHIHQLGVTHLWFTGVIRHATQTDYTAYGIPAQHSDVVKGKAGSPYAITDYYDVDPDLATDIPHRLEEWRSLINRTHQCGMKVIMDFVPNHVAREYHSIAKPTDVTDLGAADDCSMHFSTRNNFYYCWGQPLDLSAITPHTTYSESPARATGNDHFDNHPSRDDWYETVKLNYGIDYCDAGGRSEHFSPVPDTWTKMLDILLYWAAMHIDGFRCDMAEMVPAAFWSWAIAKVKEQYPAIVFIGEVYDPNQYRAYISSGFDYLYDKVGMYDSLRNIICGYASAASITTQWQATDDIRQHMLYFLENHDEQRIASDFFAGKADKALPAHLICSLLFDNPYMLYAGQEFGERGMDHEGFSGVDGRTTIFDYWHLDTLQKGYYHLGKLTADEQRLYQAYQRILHIALNQPAACKGATFDLMYVNQHIASRQFTFLRKYDNQVLLVAVNFDDVPVTVDIYLPEHAFEYLSMCQGMMHATELLTDAQRNLNLSSHHPITVTIPANNGVVYCWNQKDKE